MRKLVAAVLVIEALGLAALTVGAGIYTALLVISPDDGAEFAGIAIMLGLLVVFGAMLGGVISLVLARLVRRGWAPALPIAALLHAIVAVSALRAR